MTDAGSRITGHRVYSVSQHTQNVPQNSSQLSVPNNSSSVYVVTKNRQALLSVCYQRRADLRLAVGSCVYKAQHSFYSRHFAEYTDARIMGIGF
ncbi:hypothetical protein BaRGS_00005694 [Batillaria attramentaria]|uniref:Uncharacterized protein n=1 Tax=Batillaria attramentaria TaxID=370345 RepID=A0ABD0LV22_9CAEN